MLKSVEPLAEESEIEQAWREEVRRRIAAADSEQAELIPWEQVRDELFARLHQLRSDA